MWCLIDKMDFILVNLDQVQYIQRKETKRGRLGHEIKLMAFIPGAKGTTKGFILKKVTDTVEWERLRKSLFHRIDKHGAETWDLTKKNYWDCSCVK